MKTEILTELYQSRELNDLIRKMKPEHLQDELKQELFLVLCEMDEQKLASLHHTKHLRFYVTRIVLNMVQSSTSPFFKKYRRIIADSLDAKTVLAGRNSFQDDEPPRFRLDLADDSEDVIEKELSYNRLLADVERVLGGMSWYSRELFKLYVHHGSAGKVIKAMKADLGGKYIPRRTILDVVKKVKTEIRQQVA